MQETQVRSLGWEDPLEKGMATQFSMLALRTPWTEEPGGLQFTGLQRVRQDLSDLAQHSTAQKKGCVLSRVRLLATPWTTVHQAPLSMELSSKNTGMGCHPLLQGILLTEGSNTRLLRSKRLLFISLTLWYFVIGAQAD